MERAPQVPDRGAPPAARLYLRRHENLADRAFERRGWRLAGQHAELSPEDHFEGTLIGKGVLAGSTPVLFAQGTHGLCSNNNYIALGLVLEKMTRHQFSPELQRHIRRPLALRRTVRARHGFHVVARPKPDRPVMRKDRSASA